MNQKLTLSQYAAIGVMLFALFFGAGNLIFPAQLGQYSGEALAPAVIGFLITGVGLPLLGVLAIGYSGSSDLQDLASRVHPIYGIGFTALLYLTIGPFFATPRTATAAFDIGISGFFNEVPGYALLVFSAIYFGIALWLSLNPSKLVDRVGKILAPGIIVLLGIMIILSLINPMGAPGEPQGAYAEGAFVKGFLEGYNTMDALASLVFAIIVINAIKLMGVREKGAILKYTVRSGLVAVTFLALIYVGIAYIGSTSTEAFGYFETGGPVLSSAANFYFGAAGQSILAIIVILACLTTAIGLITANAEYFSRLIPKVSYKVWAVIFALISFTIANFGLANIIKFSIPVLMFLYPLAITIMLLAFTSPLFKHARFVYVSTIGVAFIISIFDGLKAFCDLMEISYFGWMQAVINFFDKVLPLYSQGVGWLVPVAVVLVLTGVIARVIKTEQPSPEINVQSQQ